MPDSQRLAYMLRYLRSCHMASGVSLAALGALCVALAGCRGSPQRALDPELASCVPRNTRLLAGIQIGQVRANPVLDKWFTGSLSLLMPAHDATEVLLAYSDAGLLRAARGSFRDAPPGATLLGPQLALTGPDAVVRNAAAQHASRRTGAPELVAQAELVATQPVWVVAIGNKPYPFSGNAANLNRLLALTGYTTLTLDAGSRIGLHLTGICQSAVRARQFEETLRALLSLARATMHDRDLESALSAVQVGRDNLTVRVDISGPPELAERLLRYTVPQ